MSSLTNYAETIFLAYAVGALDEEAVFVGLEGSLLTDGERWASLHFITNGTEFPGDGRASSEVFGAIADAGQYQRQRCVFTQTYATADTTSCVAFNSANLTFGPYDRTVTISHIGISADSTLTSYLICAVPLAGGNITLEAGSTLIIQQNSIRIDITGNGNTLNGNTSDTTITVGARRSILDFILGIVGSTRTQTTALSLNAQVMVALGKSVAPAATSGEFNGMRDVVFDIPTTAAEFAAGGEILTIFNTNTETFTWPNNTAFASNDNNFVDTLYLLAISGNIVTTVARKALPRPIRYSTNFPVIFEPGSISFSIR